MYIEHQLKYSLFNLQVLRWDTGS